MELRSEYANTFPQMGAHQGDPRYGNNEWEDDDDDEGAGGGPQCAQQ